jgi:hypothetical protein
LKYGTLDDMSDYEPAPPPGARLAGYAIAALGWLFFAAAVALVVVSVVGIVKPVGFVLALLSAGCGWAALALGSSVKNSRAGRRPTDRG